MSQRGWEDSLCTILQIFSANKKCARQLERFPYKPSSQELGDRISFVRSSINLNLFFKIQDIRKKILKHVVVDKLIKTLATLTLI